MSRNPLRIASLVASAAVGLMATAVPVCAGPPASTVKTPPAILGLLPPPPAVAAEARARLGRITKGDGTKTVVEGDVKSAAAARELQKWALAMGEAKGAPPDPAAEPKNGLTKEQQDALTALGSGYQKNALETVQAQTKFAGELGAYKRQLLNQLRAIDDELRARPGAAADRDARLDAARNAYLHDIAGLFTEYHKRIEERVNEIGGLLTMVKLQFGDSPPMFVRFEALALEKDEHKLISLLLAANCDATATAAAPLAR